MKVNLVAATDQSITSYIEVGSQKCIFSSIYGCKKGNDSKKVMESFTFPSQSFHVEALDVCW